MPRIISLEIHQRTLTRPLRVLYCNSPICRLRGLMFRRQIAPEEGLLLVHKGDSRMEAAIHMFFCFTDLAVIWITSKHEVVDMCLAKKWAPAYIPRKPAKYVLEIHPSRLNEFQIGDRIQFNDV